MDDFTIIKGPGSDASIDANTEKARDYIAQNGDIPINAGRVAVVATLLRNLGFTVGIEVK